jgi:uncharacterized protein YigE (DUF2233 family)
MGILEHFQKELASLGKINLSAIRNACSVGLGAQIEGEAHFVFSGQIVRGDMFYANPSLKKAQLRVPQLLQLGQEMGNAA